MNSRYKRRKPTRATVEHKKAKMDGGKDNVANLAAACQHCNQHRGQQMNQRRRQVTPAVRNSK